MNNENEKDLRPICMVKGDPDRFDESGEIKAATYSAAAYRTATTRAMQPAAGPQAQQTPPEQPSQTKKE